MEHTYKANICHILFLLTLLLGVSVGGYGQTGTENQKEEVMFAVKNAYILHRNGIKTGEEKDCKDNIRGLLDLESGSDEIIEGIYNASSSEKSHWYKDAMGEVDNSFSRNAPYTVIKDSKVGYNILQSAHTYIDSIYYVPGEEVDLWIPDMMVDGNSKGNMYVSSRYERWYNYRKENLEFEGGKLVFYQKHTDLIGGKERTINASNAYQYKNGYVIFDGSRSESGGALSNHLIKGTFITNDNIESKNETWDLVVCDLSSYMDEINTFKDVVVKEKGDESPIEPSLTHRVIFYLKSIYAKNGLLAMLPKDGEQYMKEFTIHYPTTEQALKNNDSNSFNSISLSMTADNYCLKPANEQTARNGEYQKGEYIIVDIKTDNGITLSPYSNKEKVLMYEGGGSVVSQKGDLSGTRIYLSGKSQNIFLVYPEGGVESGSTAIVTVTNQAGHRIARYNLIFDDNTEGLTESALTEIKNLHKKSIEDPGFEYNNIKNNENPQIKQLFTDKEVESAEDLLNKLYTRTDEYMKANYGEPYIRLNWDYKNPSTNNGYYPYPMDWDYSSYAFFDGTQMPSESDSKKPEWGQYAITNKVIFSGKDNFNTFQPSETGVMGYHLYIDAAHQPGVITKIPLSTELCKDTRLHVSAWIKSGGYDATKQDVAVTFSFKGVSEDGTETYIHRQSSGQIRRSDHNGLTGASHPNEWFQIHFSFDNDKDAADKYKSYLLQLESNCAGTDGSDIYIDDICIYLDKLRVDAQQNDAPCGGEVKVELSTELKRLQERILSLGEGTTDGNKDIVLYYSFLDKKIYDETIKSEDSNWSDAFNAAVIHGDKVYQRYDEHSDDGEQNTDWKYGSFLYDLEEGSDDVKVEGDWLKFTSVVRSIVLNDKEAEDKEDNTSYLQSEKEYYVVFAAHPQGESLPNNGDIPSEFNLEEPCSVQGQFTVKGPSFFTVYGDAEGGNGNVCLNEDANIRIEPSDETKELLEKYNIETLYVDYFWSNSEVDYETMKSDEIGIVLAALRRANADKEDYPNYNEEGELESLRSTLKSLSWVDLGLEDKEEKLIAQIVTCVKNGTLSLTAKSSVEKTLNVALDDCILESSPMYYIIYPIEQTLDGDNGESGIKICWKPIFGEIEATGGPKLNTGFSDVTYPDDYPNPAVRIGLEELQKAQYKAEISTTFADGQHKLRIPLRNPQNSEGKPATLKLIDKDENLYLQSTEDAKFKDKFQTKIAEIVTFATSEGEAEDYMEIVFYNDFTPREGYTYYLNFRFKLAELSSLQKLENQCDQGSLTFPMHIVPKYQKWTGSSTDNWNNDTHWVRSKVEELKKTGTDEYKDYDDPHKGFVPMSFTYVTIPTDKPQVELYEAENLTSNFVSDSHPILNLVKKGGTEIGVTESATENIEYDLMADVTGANITMCRTYYTNTVNQIHFEPNTEMLHTELLTYNKAWVDYKLDPNRWYTLASPLKNVVAGDWFVPKDGYQQNTEYFIDITQFSTDIYNRFNPAVYQRSWDKGNVSRHESSELQTTSTIKGNWSIVYNDVAVKNEPGQGFSLKTVPASTVIAKEGDGTVLFRQPKDVNGYHYYDKEGGFSGTEVIVHGDQKTGQLYHEKGETSPHTVEITNTDPDNMFFLVGNPFMAHLDMTEFFNENNSVIESKYWFVDGTNQEVAVKDANLWNSTKTVSPGLIAPLQSFFVKKTSTNTSDPNTLSIQFTNEMQTLGVASNDSWLNSTMPTITLTARKGNRQSKALIVAKAKADDNYQSKEDAELFLDSNLSDVPTVYTVAGNQTTSINVRKDLSNIPFGIYSNDDSDVELTITGQEDFGNLELYDAETNSSRLIGNGEVTVTLKGNTHGRYFLRSDYVPTGNEVVKAKEKISIYSMMPGQVIVSSVDPLTRILVYNLSGQLVSTRTDLHTPTAYLDGLNPGQIYIVRAETADQVQTEKVEVR